MEKLIINNDDRYFKIFFAGSDVYFTMDDYNEENASDNRFVINHDNILYDYLEELFNNHLKGQKVLEWYSEAYGKIETQNKLTITREKKQYIIDFFQNKENLFNLKGTCYVCFCLSGSNNQKIANYFGKMLNELIYNKSLVKKK